MMGMPGPPSDSNGGASGDIGSDASSMSGGLPVDNDDGDANMLE